MTEDLRTCETCGNDTFKIRDIYSKAIEGIGQILMGILYSCAVCKNEEYEKDL